MKNYSFLPVAIRCNNPLNITHVKDGVCNHLAVATYRATNMVPAFLVFRSFEDGFLAGLELLHTHYLGLSINDVIRKWCPDSTASSYCTMVDEIIRTFIPAYMHDYLDAFRIGNHSGVFNFAYKRILSALLLSMAYVECGKQYSDILPDYASVEEFVDDYFLFSKH